MTVRRSQGQGAFGGGVQANPRPSTDWSGLISASINGVSSLLQQAALRKVAARNQAAQELQRQQEFELRQQTQKANDLYRNAVLQHTNERDANLAARQNDQDWNTNAARNVTAAQGQARNDETARHNMALEEAAAAKPVAPLLGSPERLKAVTDEADAKAKATAKYRVPRMGSTKADPKEAAKQRYLQTETTRLMKPTKTASGRDVPGMSFEDAQAQALQHAGTMFAAPVTQPLGRNVMGSNRPVTAPVISPSTTLAAPQAAVKINRLKAKAAGWTDAEIDAEERRLNPVKKP